MKRASLPLVFSLLMLWLISLGFGVNHVVGSMGDHSASSNVAMLAEMGPLTHCHDDLAFVSFRCVEFHTVLIRLWVSAPERFQRAVQDLTCSVGIRTLGPAVSAEKRPMRKAHRRTEVAHVPAAIRPVAFAMLALALLTREGDMPIAVKP